MAVRLAKPGDAAGILEIYAPHVISGSCTFEIDVPTEEAIRQRIENGLLKFPWIVYEIDGQIGGYVYASSHREREAYQWTCECSVYVHPEFKGKGLGEKMYRVLFNMLKIQGLVNVYAGISLPNEASVRLHEKCGFLFFAGYENVGYKLGAWQKVGWWKLQLLPYLLNPPPPLKFSSLDPSVINKMLADTEA